MQQPKPFRHRKGLTQALRFGLVGVSNTLIDFALYWILSRYVLVDQYVVAKMISYFGALINSYMMNKYWTFGSSERSLAEAVRFLLIIFASWAANSLAMRLLIGLGMADVLAFFFATLVSALFNFTLQKFFTFRK
jgi:putative flippase GtrA